ncbi:MULTISPECIES: hypothetical protein [Bacillaceae]|uniref:tetratricopeptide repeat protein n=1 Tax=Bacillaceae TaxID=186817 RepID=UPI0008EECE2B|nr:MULTISPECIES: hypothetical protein [Bacillaceae]PGZ88286.1 hypothetical protein COE53_20100 [Bacillus sp. AFS029533]SFC33599.1 pentatricopeptide repeat domain-containing protein (PPR motif) [Bacillus sp. UNCCL81]
MRKYLLYILYFKLTWDLIHLVYKAWGENKTQTLGFDTISIFIDLFIILILLKTKKSRKSLTKFKHFHNEALNCDDRKEYEKALQIREEALNLHSLSDLQRAELYVGNGGTYSYLKDYENATNSFDKAFELVKLEKIPYDEQYKVMIDCYVKANRKEDAIKLVEELLERQSYNKKFKRLQPIMDQLLT